MSNNIKVLGDLELAGSMSFAKNYVDFPSNPQPRTVVVKDGVPYIYTELVNGSGFFSWQPIGVKQASYLHSQGVASTVWTVTHNFNTNDFAYFVYDANHNLVVANIELVDLNTVKIHLTSAITGTVVLFSMQYLNSTTISATQQLNLGSGVLTTDAGVLKVSGNAVAFQSAVDAADAVLSTRISNIESNIDPVALDSLTEIVAAFQAADGDLSAAIGAMGTSAVSSLGDEVVRAQLAEAGLQSGIDAETARATAAESALSVSISNIGDNLATVASTGSYTDLTNKPTLFSGSYSDLSGKPTTLAGYGITDGITSGGTVASADKLTTPRTIALSSDVTGSVSFDGSDNATIASTLATVNSTVGRFGPTGSIGAGRVPFFTVNAKGLITSAGSFFIDWGDLTGKPTTLAGYGITDAQAKDADLTAIAGLTGTAGILKKTAANTWTLDTTAYQTASDVSAAIEAVVGAAPAALDTLAEIATQLANDESAVSSLTNVVSTKAATTYVDTQLALKADSSALATVATSGSYTDLINKPTIPSVPTAVSAFTNDAGYLVAADLSTLTGGLSSSVTDLATEVADRIAGDATLQSNIDAVAASLATVATSGSYADLTNKPTIPTVPTLVSAFTNDSGYQTAANVTSAIQAVVGAAPAALDTLAEIATQLANDESVVSALTTTVAGKVTANTAITAGTGTKITYDAKGLVTSSTTLSASDIPSLDWAKITTGKPTTLAGYGITDAYTKTAIDSSLALKVNTSSLATVATSGSYVDLTNKPTIPTVPTTVSSFTNDSGYQTASQVNTTIGSAIIDGGSF